MSTNESFTITCERCEAEVAYADSVGIQTHRATRYEPADGIMVCGECAEEIEDAEEAAMERAGEERAERDYEYDF